MRAIVDSVFSLFIMILIGIYSGRKKIITPEINGHLTNILIKVSLPFMIVTSFIFTFDNNIKSNLLKTLFYSPLVYIIMIVLSLILLKPIKKGHKKDILHFSNIFTNTGYIGFPLLLSIYGQEGIVYGSLFNMFFQILLWSYGILIFEGGLSRDKFKKQIIGVFSNPIIIAVFMGIIILFFNIQLPQALITSMDGIGSMASPLSMIIIGVILANVKFKDYIRDWTIYYGIFTRLIAIPAIISLILILFTDMSKSIIVIIIMTSLPTSAMTSVFAENFNKEKEYTAILVSITTLLSLITIPILLKIILSI